MPQHKSKFYGNQHYAINLFYLSLYWNQNAPLSDVNKVRQKVISEEEQIITFGLKITKIFCNSGWLDTWNNVHWIVHN